MIYFALAYLLVWLLLFFYVAWLGKNQREMNRRLEGLLREIPKEDSL